MLTERTLRSLLGGLSLFILFMGMLSGFVPQDEGPSLRRSVSTMIVHLSPEDLPAPITACGDGQHIWAIRETAGGTPPLASQEEQSIKACAIRFLGDSVVLVTGRRESDYSPDTEGLVSVPLLALDGFSMPGLFAAHSLPYADILDELGIPVRWHFDQTLQTGYTPFVLRRRQSGAEENLLPVFPKKNFIVRGHGLGKAAAFEELIHRFSRQFSLDPTLIKAIIYSESNFNTALVSRRSAVGLMQVLPQTAGADIHRFLYGHKANISFNDLFDPETNIRYGTAYLHILMRRYFSAVRDPLSREYCTVAAYNMGPHRVIRLFGQTAAEAAATLNGLSSEEVFTMLVSRLPRQETRSYVAKVRSLKQQYAALGAK